MSLQGASFLPGLPGAGEFPPYAIRYVQLVPEEDLLGVLRSELERTLAPLAAFDEERARTWRYAEGKWTLNEVLGHMVDTERVMAYRALCIARGEKAALPSFEQDDYVANAPFAECTAVALAEEWRVVRASTVMLLEKLSPAMWMRPGNAAGAPCTVRGLGYVIAGHERYHQRILRERYLG